MVNGDAEKALKPAEEAPVQKSKHRCGSPKSKEGATVVENTSEDGHVARTDVRRKESDRPPRWLAQAAQDDTSLVLLWRGSGQRDAGQYRYMRALRFAGNRCI